MPKIAEFPYFEVQFTKDGTIHDPQQAASAARGIAQTGATDLLVFSHGWNNHTEEARELYREFFTSVRGLIDAGRAPALAGRTFAVLGVLWPSKKFADSELIPSGAASGAGVPDEAITGQLARLKETLETAEAAALLGEAEDLLPELEFDPAARDAFVEKIRAALPPPDDDEETAGEFFAQSGAEIMSLLEPPLAVPGAPGFHASGPDAAGTADAAGLGDVFGGVKAAALRVANYATYYVMKNRASVVGRKGVRQTIEQILTAAPDLRFHLVGHSFGARVVTSAADALGDDPATRPASLSLLQGAFSHNGFAEKFHQNRDGFFRKVVTGKKVRGPIVITHTKNDTANGIAYPIASRLAGQDAAALGDENDRFGAIGRNGGQHTPEAEFGIMQPLGGAYRFAAGKVFNLQADAYISNHGAVTSEVVAAAVLASVAASP